MKSHHSFKLDPSVIAKLLAAAVAVCGAEKIAQRIEAKVIEENCRHPANSEEGMIACFLERNAKDYIPQVQETKIIEAMRLQP